jgi:inulin fructotransferase (DFA-I-forming)
MIRQLICLPVRAALFTLRGSAESSEPLSYEVPAGSVNPPNQPPTMVLVASGSNNFIATNTVASVPVRTVVLDGATAGTKVLDCGTSAEFQAHGSPHSFRATP